MDKPWVGIDDPGQIILTDNRAYLDILKASLDQAIVKENQISSWMRRNQISIGECVL